jgi:hypothetical protein
MFSLRNGLAVLVAFSLAACQKQEGKAIVVNKEHIAAAPVATPTPKNDSGPTESATQGEPREMGPDEIAVDGYVMKQADRGSSRDPRASHDEQWLVKVRTISGERTFNVSTNKDQFEKLKEGDRVRVKYRVGKYTGTVWSSEIGPE